MKPTLFDTSCLVAAFCAWHESHERCRLAFSKAKAHDGALVVAAHTIIELYSVLSRLPAPHRLAPDVCYQIIQENLRVAHTVPATTQTYWDVLIGCRAKNISGGTVYDALIVQAAVIAKVQTIVTLNTKHFSRLVPDEIAVVSP